MNYDEVGLKRPASSLLMKKTMILKMMTNENEDEHTLLCQIQKGDTQAMKEIYARYVKYLTAICLRYVQDEEDVKDILQDSFLKIFSSIHSFEYRGVGSLKGWVAKIVVNETLKFIKQNNRVVFLEINQEKMNIIDEEPDT